MNQFKNLKAWQKSKEMAIRIYDFTSCFPLNERYVMMDQMRRSAVSIPSNIAEGAGRASQGDFRRFVRMAMGSSYELETQLMISSELGYFSSKDPSIIFEELTEIQKMLAGLEKSLSLERLKTKD